MNHLSVADIVLNGETWNREWIQGLGANHWLASCWKTLHRQSSTFVETSCEVTAAAIRWKSGLGDELKLVDDGYQFEDIEKESPYFQISIGEDWSDCEHIVTILDGHLIQSYYQRYKVQSQPITDEIRQAFNKIASEGSYETVTRSQSFPEGVMHREFGKLKTYYWLPPKF